MSVIRVPSLQTLRHHLHYFSTQNYTCCAQSFFSYVLSVPYWHAVADSRGGGFGGAPPIGLSNFFTSPLLLYTAYAVLVCIQRRKVSYVTIHALSMTRLLVASPLHWWMVTLSAAAVSRCCSAPAPVALVIESFRPHGHGSRNHGSREEATVQRGQMPLRCVWVIAPPPEQGSWSTSTIALVFVSGKW